MIDILKETQKAKEQEVAVSDLSRRYAEQSAILRVIRKNLQTLQKNLAELRSVLNNETKAESPEEEETEEWDERYSELNKLLNEAIDIAISRGLITATVQTKTGATLNMRKRALNRARDCIISNCIGFSFIDYIRAMSEEDMYKFRHVGKQTREVLKIAQSIADGQTVR